MFHLFNKISFKENCWIFSIIPWRWCKTMGLAMAVSFVFHLTLDSCCLTNCLESFQIIFPKILIFHYNEFWFVFIVKSFPLRILQVYFYSFNFPGYWMLFITWSLLILGYHIFIFSKYLLDISTKQYLVRWYLKNWFCFNFLFITHRIL